MTEPQATVLPRLESSRIGRLVGGSVAGAWILVAVVIILCAVMARYVTREFAMTTDTYAKAWDRKRKSHLQAGAIEKLIRRETA